MDIQAILDAISDSATQTRKQYHLTLGKFIKYLEEEYNSGNGNWRVILDSSCITAGYPEYLTGFKEIGLDVLDSYRGYYEDLAFDVCIENGTDTSVEALLDELRASIGMIFEGYKGGEYRAHKDSVLWISRYGSCDNIAITGIKKDEENRRYLIQTKLIED